MHVRLVHILDVFCFAHRISVSAISIQFVSDNFILCIIVG